MTATGDAQESSQATAIPPATQLREMINGINLSWMLYAVAERGVADLLADGPQTSTELAQAAGVHEPSLYRLLRSLSSFGVFEEESPHRFALNPLGSALQTGDPSAARDMVMLLPWFGWAWAEFPRTVAGGENGMQLAFGMPVFEYLAQNPTESANFNRTMIATGAGCRRQSCSAGGCERVAMVDIAGQRLPEHTRRVRKRKGRRSLSWPRATPPDTGGW